MQPEDWLVDETATMPDPEAEVSLKVLKTAKFLGKELTFLYFLLLLF